ncbi:MAG TPA: hypothetical protein VMK65_03565 [Longimicrobiales bacterium]|nr:hypothetical protein [Longimicrobiales bacterium]
MMLTRSLTTLALLAAAAPLGAQAPDDARWLPWVGCWEAETDAALERSAAADVLGRALCVRPAGAGVELIAFDRDGTPATRLLIADGARRPLELGGCAGWESATWSADGVRLFHRSELTCPGDVVRAASGVLAMLPGEVWLDAQALEAGGERMLAVRRYRPAAARDLPAMADPIGEDLVLAVATTRASAAARLSTSDVVDATRHLPAEVVQALLVERGAGFHLDAASMLRLAEAGVPGEVTDLMVALSWPERFAVETGETLRVAAREVERDSLRAPVYDPWRDPWVRPDPFYNPRGYGGWGHDPYGYGYGARGLPGTWRLGGGPVVVVRERSQDRGGQMVKGRGYSADGASSGGAAGVRSGGSGSVAPTRSGGASGAAVGSSRGSSSGKSTGRTAKPRPGSKKEKNH